MAKPQTQQISIPAQQLFEVIKSTTTTTMPITTKETTTQKPVIIIPQNDNAEILELIDNVETFLIIIVVILSMIILAKIIKMCKKGYKMHNNKVIQKHESTSARI